jgi:hypothetical protein
MSVQSTDLRWNAQQRGKCARSVRFSPNLRDLPPIAAHRDKAQMLDAHFGRLRIAKVALNAPQPGRIRRVR